MTQNSAGGGPPQGHVGPWPTGMAHAMALHQQNQSNTFTTTGGNVTFPSSGGTITAPNTFGGINDWSAYMPQLSRADRELAFLKEFVKEKEEIVWRLAYEAKWSGKEEPKKQLDSLDQLYRMVQDVEAEVRREKDTP